MMELGDDVRAVTVKSLFFLQRFYMIFHIFTLPTKDRFAVWKRLRVRAELHAGAGSARAEKPGCPCVFPLVQATPGNTLQTPEWTFRITDLRQFVSGEH